MEDDYRLGCGGAVVLRLVTLQEAWRAIEWNVLLLYFGMLFVSEVFLISRMPDYLATLVAGKAKTTGHRHGDYLCLYRLSLHHAGECSGSLAGGADRPGNRSKRPIFIPFPFLSEWRSARICKEPPP